MGDQAAEVARFHVLGRIEAEAIHPQAQQLPQLGPLQPGHRRPALVKVGQVAVEPAPPLADRVAVAVIDGAAGVEVGRTQPRKPQRPMAGMAAHVVEHHIGDHPQATAVGAVGEGPQISGAATAADAPQIHRLVAPPPLRSGAGDLGGGDEHMAVAIPRETADLGGHGPEGFVVGMHDRRGASSGSATRQQRGQGGQEGHGVAGAVRSRQQWVPPFMICAQAY
jgi:hypothetical protein